MFGNLGLLTSSRLQASKLQPRLQQLRFALRMTLCAFSGVESRNMRLKSPLMRSQEPRIATDPALSIAARVRITTSVELRRASNIQRSPNVKDEPRRELARGVRQHDS